MLSLKKVALLLLIPTATMALDIQLVQQIPSEVVTSYEVEILNTSLVYKTDESGSETLWAINNQTLTKSKLFTTEQGEIEFHGQINQQLIFSQNSDCCQKIWKSDGTTDGTVPLTIKEHHGFTDQGPWVVGKYAANTLFRTNGQSTTLIEIDSPLEPESFCIFENGNVIVSSSEGRQLKLNQINQSDTSDLTAFYTDANPNNYTEYFETVLVNNNCFVTYYVYEEPAALPLQQLSVFNQSGQLQSLFPQHQGTLYFHPKYDDLSGKYFVVKNRYNTGLDYDSTLMSFDINDGSEVASYNKLDNRFSMRNYVFLNGKVAALYDTPAESPSVPLVEYFTQDLTLIENLPFNAYDWPNHQFWRNQSLILFNKSWFAGGYGTMQLYSESNGQLSSPLELNGVDGAQLVSSDNRHHAYIMAFNVATNDQLIYKVTDQTKLASHTGGHWHSSEYKNQGLSISHGVRGNLSEYLFIAVYTYQEGSPLWMAGMVELDGNMTSATLPLYRFDGLNMWQTDAAAEQTQLGEMTIQHASCDKLNVSFDIQDTLTSFQVKRMDNIAIRDVCQD